MQEFEVGDPVLVMDGENEVSGRVESIQLKPAHKIDVRIYDKSSKRHGTVVAFDPSDVSLGEKEADEGASSYAELQKRVEGERSSRTNQELLSVVKGMAEKENAALKKLEDAITALTERVATLETLPSALSELHARVDALEVKHESPDGGKAASA